MAVINSSVSKNTFVVTETTADIILLVSKITFVTDEITFKVAVITSAVVKDHFCSG